MDWSKAKNVSIIAFTMLNATLMLLLYLNSRQYVLGSDNQRAIITVLNNNNITLSYDFNFISSEPRRNISLTNHNMSQNALVSIFMINNSNILIDIGESEVTFYNDYEMVMFTLGNTHYKNINNNDNYLPTLTDKRRFSTYIIASLGDIGRYFLLDTTKQIQNGYVLTYRQAYRNNLIYSNFITFTFYDSNIYSIDFLLNPAYAFLGNLRQIYPNDEVLLTFMRKYKNENTPIKINSIDIVYNAQGLVATPYYRVTYTKHNMTRTMLINARVNVVN